MILRAQVDADKSACTDLSGTQKDMGFYLQSASLKRAGTCMNPSRVRERRTSTIA